MSRMLPGVETLKQHQALLDENPDVYRPACCPKCGRAGLHHHGCYERNPPRGEGLFLELGVVLILRFFCPACRRTCSRLPACLSPRRQYWWKRQQAVIEQLCAGAPARAVAREELPSRHTIRRWRDRVERTFDLHALHLRSRFAEMGRGQGWAEFRSYCLHTMSLSQAMGWLDHDGVVVP